MEQFSEEGQWPVIGQHGLTAKVGEM